ncbi:MAG: acyltransferase family protein [Opitutaceae bacterium]|nr:acyltransferase family protein [Opitutaceae bacterium]
MLIPPAVPSTQPAVRLDYLDATRAFALLLGIVFHASLSFMPVFIGWAVQDVSTGPAVAAFVVVSHSFRMELFFLLAGFFGYGMLRRRGVGGFSTSRAVRLLVPWVVGWFVLRPLLVAGWVMGAESLRGDASFWGGIRTGFESMRALPDGLLTGTHLWFLQYLAMVTALALLGRAVLVASGASGAALMRGLDAAVARLAGSPVRLPLLVLATAGVLWFMDTWGMDTPDRSLVPHVPVLLIYGGFFGFGWMVGRQPELLERTSRLSWSLWAAAVLGIAVTLGLIGVQANPAHARFFEAHVVFLAGYATMMWTLVLLTLGVFRTCCSRARPAVRYLADASYWMYLAHLPVVVWLQVAVAEVPVHWALKLGFIAITALAVLLASYDLLVRPTVVGQVLNGSRRPRVLFAWASRTRAVAA